MFCMKKILWGLVVLFLTEYTPIACSVETSESKPEPTLEKGASIFKQRCALCHGNDGSGAGLLPLKIKNYPDTNLLTPRKSITRDEVFKVVTHGGSMPGISEFMPPMGDDLTWTATESVVSFVMLLRTNAVAAQKVTVAISAQIQPSYKEGMDIFLTRCALCHGESGKGNGRLSKIINNPPPFDLTSSRKPDEYLEKMIMNGGAFMGRSPQMPAWGEQLLPMQIKSVIIYIKSIRQ